MNRLWMRLSVAFAMVILLGLLSIILSYVVLSRTEAIEPPLHLWLNIPNGVLERLGTYYNTHHGWEGVSNFLQGAESGMSDARYVLVLQDYASQTLYNVQDSAEITPDTSPSTEAGGQDTVQAKPIETLPVTVDGQVRATLKIYRRNQPLSTSLTAFILSRLRDFVLLAASVGAVVGIVAGTLVSRTLTAPLSQLASAAQAIGAHELHRRVEETGTEEVAAVARAFNDMADAIEKAATLRRNLVADVAHELRTPLSVLQGNLLAILDDVYPLDKQEIARLYSQTHLLSRLVNDLHELSLAEAHQLRLHLQQVAVGNLLAGVVSAFEPTADEAEVHLELRVAPHLPTALVDPMRVTQILDNLLGNALRYTPAGGKITLNASALSKTLIILVKDSGEGITAEHLPHVFDRFYRTDKARSRANGGTGLGLAIVRALVEMHGGQITVSSDGIPGHGASFCVQLPVLVPGALGTPNGGSGALAALHSGEPVAAPIPPVALRD